MQYTEIGDTIIMRIKMAHRWLLEATAPLTDEEFCQQLGPTSPPIGWHLWHMGRWADRVQASLPRTDDPEGFRPDPNRGIWERERLAAEWDLDATRLGTLEDGSGMDHADAARLPHQIGRKRITDYATRTFTALDDALTQLGEEEMRSERLSVMEVQSTGGKITRSQGKRTTLAADLGFHFSHAYRHLGMIEALRGLMDRDGTITI